MRTGKWIFALVLLVGFLGGSFASMLTRPVIAQGQGYSAPQIFLNGQEVVPKNGKITIITQDDYKGPYHIWSNEYDGQIVIHFQYDPHPTF